MSTRPIGFLLYVAVTLATTGHVVLPAEQAPAITLTVLYDNYVFDKHLEKDWGFACLISGIDKTTLFDTGTKGPLLLENMKKVSVRPDAAGTVVISHNHRDHTGGLLPLLEKDGKPTVYLPPSCPKSMVQEVESTGAKIVVVTKPMAICKGVSVVGPIGERIVEQALAVDTSKGLVIITGCSHPGIVEIVKRAKGELKRNVYMVCGGMHLLQMSEAEVRGVVQQLKDLGVQKIGPTHCTGDKAIAIFKEAFGDGFLPMGVGRAVVLEK